MPLFLMSEVPLYAYRVHERGVGGDGALLRLGGVHQVHDVDHNLFKFGVQGLGFRVQGQGLGLKDVGIMTCHPHVQAAPRMPLSSKYKSISPTRKCTPLGPYCRPIPRVLGGS